MFILTVFLMQMPTSWACSSLKHWSWGVQCYRRGPCIEGVMLLRWSLISNATFLTACKIKTLQYELYRRATAAWNRNYCELSILIIFSATTTHLPNPHFHSWLYSIKHFSKFSLFCCLFYTSRCSGWVNIHRLQSLVLYYYYYYYGSTL